MKKKEIKEIIKIFNIYYKYRLRFQFKIILIKIIIKTLFKKDFNFLN